MRNYTQSRTPLNVIWCKTWTTEANQLTLMSYFIEYSFKIYSSRDFELTSLWSAQEKRSTFLKGK